MFKIPFWPRSDSRRTAPLGGKPTYPKLILALGNTGDKYEGTYHNVGFAYADYLVKEAGLTFRAYKKDFQFSKLGGLTILKPLGFMNESGKAASKALKYFGVRPEEVVVVHDESDLKLGGYKISAGRGSAGHKGVESVARHLKTNNFTRVRIGIRKGRGKAGGFVLKKITPKDREILESLFSEIKRSLPVG